MNTVKHILNEIDQNLDGSLTLNIVRSWDQYQIFPERILLSTDAAEALRGICRSVRQSIGSGDSREYVGTAELEEAEFFLIYDEDTIRELAIFGVMDQDVGALPKLSPSALDSRTIMYCASLGDFRPRTLFIKKIDPRLNYKTGRFLATGRERLAVVDEPAFSFAPNFDIVIGSGWAIVLNQRAFELLFRDIGIVEAHVESWISGITDYLPMTDRSINELKRVALQDSRTWRRLKEIKRRGHLSRVDVVDIARYAYDVGLDPHTLIVDDRLVFDPLERFEILKLLNEDVYLGNLTEQRYEAQRKSS